MVTATTDNTIRTFVLLLCPFIDITCKIVDAICRPLFASSGLNNLPGRILGVPKITPLGGVACNLICGSCLRFDKPFQHRVIFCPIGKMALNRDSISKGFSSLHGIKPVDVCPRHCSFDRFGFASLTSGDVVAGDIEPPILLHALPLLAQFSLQFFVESVIREFIILIISSAELLGATRTIKGSIGIQEINRYPNKLVSLRILDRKSVVPISFDIFPSFRNGRIGIVSRVLGSDCGNEFDFQFTTVFLRNAKGVTIWCLKHNSF